MKKEFISVFQMSKTIIFEVKFYTLSANKNPYFTTSAARFCRSKRDFNCCGQAQKALLRNYPEAMRFFRKWDKLHLQDMDEEQYAEMRSDLENLKSRYNYIFEELDERKKPYNPGFGFHRLAEWAKQEPRKRNLKIGA